MEPVEYLRLVRRRWRLLAACVVVAGVVAWITTPAEPSDRQVTFEAEHVLLRDAAALTPPPALAQLALFVRTGAVPERVAERLATGESAGDLAERVEVEPDEPSGSLTIVASAPTRAAAAELANVFGEEALGYLGEQVQAAQAAAIQGVNEDVIVLQAQLDDLEGQIQAANDAGAPTAVLQAQRDAKVREYALALDEQTQILDQPPPSAGYATLAAASEDLARPANGGFETPRSRGARLALAVLFGLALGVAAILIAERLDPRINTREGAEDAFGLPVVAEVPRLAKARGRDARSIAFETSPFSAMAEAHRSLRSAILLTPVSQLGPRPGRVEAAAHEPRVVLVTSPTPGEGKTTTVANLAAAFAETGRSVLVLSCDFRRPEVHNYFDAPDSPGLSDVLTRAKTLGDVARPTPVNGVLLAPDGGGLRHLGDLSAEGHEVIGEASTLADIVLIDTPPLLATNDATELIAAVDAVVVACRSGGTTTEAARRTRVLLERLSTPVVGVVLVGVPEAEATYADYYSARVAEGAEARPLRPTPPERHEPEPAPTVGGGLPMRSPTAISRRLKDRVLVLAEGDELLTLEGTAIEVWDELEQPSSVDDIAQRLAEKHGANLDEVTTDVREVVDRLLKGGAAVEVRP